MFQVAIYVCVLQAAVAIIVTDPPPTSTEYNYWYDIVDPNTGDAKSLHEIRQGDDVKGSYSVIDPDGIKRIVDYVAGKHGFKATVRREPMIIQSNNQVKIHNNNLLVALGGNMNVYPMRNIKKYQTSMFSTNNFIENSEPTYFTPGNDTSSENLSFNPGEYFMPRYMRN